MLKKKLNKKGFSLIELIIVIAIMAILAAIIVPTVINKVQEANESAAATEAQNLANAVQQDIIEIAAGGNDTTYVASVNGSTIALKADRPDTIQLDSTGTAVIVSVTVKGGGTTYAYTIDSKGKITQTSPSGAAGGTEEEPGGEG